MLFDCMLCVFKNYIMNEKLYKILDEAEELTDSERRQIYAAEDEAEKDYEDWCEDENGW